MAAFSISNSAVGKGSTRSPQQLNLQRPPEWPRNPQHVARAATHRKAGYFARKLIKLSEMDLLPLEIVAVVFPQFGNTHEAEVMDVIKIVIEAKLNLDRVYLETHDLRLQNCIKQARITVDVCLDYMTR